MHFAIKLSFTLIVFGILVVGFAFNRCWSHFMLTDKNFYILLRQISTVFHHKITTSYRSYFLLCFAKTDFLYLQFHASNVSKWLRFCLWAKRDETASQDSLSSLYEHFFSLDGKTRHDWMNYVLLIFADELILPVCDNMWGVARFDIIFTI